jgi:hypothetical protein
MRARAAGRLGRVIAGVALAMVAAHPAHAMAPSDLAEPPSISVADDTAVEGFDLRFAVSLSAPASSDVVVTATARGTTRRSTTSP